VNVLKKLNTLILIMIYFSIDVMYCIVFDIFVYQILMCVHNMYVICEGK